MKSGLALVCVLIFCLFLPSCGSDSLCERANRIMEMCSPTGTVPSFCAALSDCPECANEGRAYAKCIVGTDSCGEITAICHNEFDEWGTCMTEKGCLD